MLILGFSGIISGLLLYGKLTWWSAEN